MNHDFAYNLILFVVEAAGLAAALRRRGVLPSLLVGQLVFAAALARLLGAGVFGSMRLLAYGVFIHAPLLMAAAAVLLHRSARAFSALAGLAALLIVVIGVDAFFIEPYDL